MIKKTGFPISAAVAMTIVGQGAMATTTLPTVIVSGELVREELQPDSVSNPYRLSPSSRSSSQTLDRQEIAALHPRDVFELLNQATGVNVAVQGRKYPYQVTVRGDSNFAFIIDGAYLVASTASRILQDLPVSAIDELQVVRDATALTLGPLTDLGSVSSGSLNSGFIVIRTHRGTRDEVNLKGSLEQYHGQAAMVQGTKQLAAADGIRGYVGGHEAYSSSDGKSGWHNGRRSHNQILFTGFAADKLTLDLGAYFDDGNYELQRGQQGVVTPNIAYANWTYDPQQTMLLTANGHVRWSASQTTLFTLAKSDVSGTLSRDYFPYPDPAQTPANLPAEDKDSQLRQYGLRHSLHWQNTLVQVGGQYLRWDNPTGEVNYSGIPRMEHIQSWFLLAEQRLMDGRWVLDGSVRSDDKTVDKGVESSSWVNPKNNKRQALTIPYDNRELPSSTFYALGSHWQLAEAYRLNARYAYGRQGAVTGVRAADEEPLHPQKQQRWELGLEADYSDHFAPSLTGFTSRIQNDKVVAYFDPRALVSYYTETDSRRTGFELLIQGRFGTRSRYRTSWTHMASVTSSNDEVLHFLSPKDLLDMSVTHGFDAYTANLSAKYVSDYLSDTKFALDGQAKTLGDYVRFDANLSRDFALDEALLRGTLYGRNLTNQHYETVYGFPNMGAVYGIEVAVEF